MRGMMTIAMVMLSATAAAAEDTLPAMTADNLPATVEQLWADFDPDREPLDVRVIKEYQQNGITVRMITYRIGTFKGVESRMGAYYAVANERKGKLPGILYMHGGGQRAMPENVIPAARNGYACISINWGGHRMKDQGPDDPGTDWGAVDATQRHNGHYGSCEPDPKTVDTFASPRNNNWFLIVLAAKRAITFLQQQPEVAPDRIGVQGHSMGGKLTVMVAGADRRVKAAVPSCGGSGTAPDRLRQRKGNAARPKMNSEIYANCIDDAQYVKRITCPILYNGPQNDFNGLNDNLFMNWEHIGSSRVGYCISPHLNHRHCKEASFIDMLWFEEHLKGTLSLPNTPEISVDLNGPEGLPVVTIRPERPDEVVGLRIYYSQDPNGQFRFWRSAAAARTGDVWTARCPILSRDMGFFAMANVYYPFPKPQLTGPVWNSKPGSEYLLSSRVLSFEIPEVRAAAPKVTDSAERLIEKDFRDLTDWYELKSGNPYWRQIVTRKVKDPHWRGPASVGSDSAQLVIDVLDPRGGELVYLFDFNSYNQYGRKWPAGTYYVVLPIAKLDTWQTLTVEIEELKPAKGDQEPPTTWQTLCSLGIHGRHRIQVDGETVELGAGRFDTQRKLRNLRWVGGTYPRTVLMPGGDLQLDEKAYARQFQSQIDKSIELEQRIDEKNDPQ